MSKYLRSKVRYFHFVEYFFISIVWVYVNAFNITDGFDLFFLPQEVYAHRFPEIIPFFIVWLLERLLMWLNCYQFIERFLNNNVRYILVRGINGHRLLIIMQKRFLMEFIMLIITRYLALIIITQHLVSNMLINSAYYLLIMLIETAAILLLYSCTNDKRSFAAFVVFSTGIMALIRETLYRKAILPEKIISNELKSLLICMIFLILLLVITSAVLKRKDY